ncbi:sporulation protein Cse60 [Paenibacillus sp. 5J-6]|uniref:Sporulation protein Cse60 n=1 Tax=Paenibacillus silvestris TaxID=2606219 RepID=A0A6L8US62_9BACL|nr:sporulation protein Cse60 [Paenibacillus silvestris]
MKVIQVKEFLDTDSSYAESRANQFLTELSDDQVINVCYGSILKTGKHDTGLQRSSILVVYRTKE